MATPSAQTRDSSDRIILVAWLAVVAVLPFFIYPAALLTSGQHAGGTTSSPTTPVASPEMVWIFPRVLLLLLFSVPGLLWLRKRFSLDRFSLLVTLYALTFLLSAAFSRDELQYILLGASGRMDGLLYAIGLVTFMLVGYFLGKENPNLLLAFYLAISLGGVLEVVVLAAQRLGLDWLGPITRGTPYTDILTGTIGNPGMLAGMLLPISLLSLGAAQSPKLSPRLRTWATVVAVLTAAGIALTGNKSSFYGMILLLVAYVILQRSVRSLLLAGTVFIALVFAPQLVPNRTTYEHPLIPTASIAARPALWGLTLKAIAATPGQPLIGAGPDGLRMAILRNERLIPDMLDVYRISERWPENRKITVIEPVYSPTDPVRSRAFAVRFSDNAMGNLYRVNVDKAHDLFLDRAVRSGVVSALIWALLYLVPIFQLIRSREPLTNAVALALAGLTFYYLFWFPVPQVEPLHVALLSLAWGVASTTQRAEVTRAAPTKPAP